MRSTNTFGTLLATLVAAQGILAAPLVQSDASHVQLMSQKSPPSEGPHIPLGHGPVVHPRPAVNALDARAGGKGKTSSKPEEAKPAEAKPAEAKPAEAKPAEAKGKTSSKPEEAKPAEAKPAEAKPAEAKGKTSSKPEEAKPAEAKGKTSSKPEEAKPADKTEQPASSDHSLKSQWASPDTVMPVLNQAAECVAGQPGSLCANGEATEAPVRRAPKGGAGKGGSDKGGSDKGGADKGGSGGTGKAFAGAAGDFAGDLAVNTGANIASEAIMGNI